jgi:hypothetical protein
MNHWTEQCEAGIAMMNQSLVNQTTRCFQKTFYLYFAAQTSNTARSQLVTRNAITENIKALLIFCHIRLAFFGSGNSRD